ncbi:MAG: aminoacyl-tRNA hydrolase [Deltaproteobacteria bacterium]|nr:aminoacyl-tRNA hydrolase [Deltaproteobacteria bacterium]
MKGIEWLFVGLGNPGPEYAGNRHNVGFMVIDAIAKAHRGSARQSKAWGKFGEARIAGKTVALLKPQTFMNASGEAVEKYLVARPVEVGSIVVIHDDIDLDPGRVSVKRGGGDGGHRGLRSIIGRLGDPGFVRIRMGIGRPPEGEDPVEWVLEDFEGLERERIEEAIVTGRRAAELIVANGPVRAMNAINPMRPGKQGADSLLRDGRGADRPKGGSA